MGSADFRCYDGIGGVHVPFVHKQSGAALLGCRLCDGDTDSARAVIRAAVGDLVQFDLRGDAWQK
jgi:hypothetical protein